MLVLPCKKSALALFLTLCVLAGGMGLALVFQPDPAALAQDHYLYAVHLRQQAKQAENPAIVQSLNTKARAALLMAAAQNPYKAAYWIDLAAMELAPARAGAARAIAVKLDPRLVPALKRKDPSGPAGIEEDGRE